MVLTIDAPSQAPRLAPRATYRLAAAGPALWRVIGPTGLIIGHLRSLALEQGDRYRAQRYHAASGTFRTIGDFWSADEAVDCLRLST